MSDELDLIQATIATHVTPEARVVDVRPHGTGRQGFSGAPVRYYTVTYTLAGAAEQVTLVTKETHLGERRTLAWLGERDLPVPFSYSHDLTTDVPLPVCLQYVGETPPPHERKRHVARALAAIHAAGLGRGDEIGWLPRADPAFFADWLVQRCWRVPWQRLLAGGEFTDAFGHYWAPPRPNADFAADFAASTPPLEAAAARFVQAMARLWERGDSLTLIHADLHDGHARTDTGREYLIDWGFAHYGSLYVDLPNYFSRVEALLYRDALAELGHDIPTVEFLAGYDAARPYPGFKYFGVGLWSWRYGEPPHQAEHVRHFIDMVL